MARRLLLPVGAATSWCSPHPIQRGKEMFTTLSLKARILIGFALALLVALVVGLVGHRSLGRVSVSVETVARVRVPTLVALNGAVEATGAAADALDVLLLNRLGTGPDHMAAYASFEAALVRLEEARRAYEALPQSDAGAGAWKEVAAGVDAWRTVAAKLVKAERERDELLKAGRSATADPDVQFAEDRAFKAWVGQRKLVVKIRDDVAAVVRRTVEETEAARADAVSAAAEGARIDAAAILLGGLAILGLGLYLARSMGQAVRHLLGETARLRRAVTEGALASRADVAGLHFELRPALEAVNDTMDAYARPMAMATGYVTALARGELPPPITEPYRGDFERIRESLNALLEVADRRQSDIEALIQAALAGRLDQRGDPSGYQGANARVIAGINEMLDALVKPLQVAASYVDRIARGEIPAPIAERYEGDFDRLKQNLNTCVSALGALVEDASGLARAAVAGQLSARADPARHQGDFRRIVEGVNATLDAVTGPIDVAARCVERIAAGEIPPPIGGEYAGDFARLRDNLDTCIHAVNALVRDTDGLVQAAVAGKLSTRADAARHAGDFRRIVEGVNRTLDVVVAPINDATATLELLAERDLRARMEGEFSGDHARLKRALNASAEALQDALGQVSAAVEQVSSAAAQIAASSQAVASGASQQAASLQATSASIDGVATSTRAAAEHAAQAKVLATAARTSAEDGSSAAQALGQVMLRIRQSAERTSQIIRDVSDIAFQTNLLALNAAVEAARAGEAGRGFAVVAEEVRSLALRAKDAATRTDELIRESVRQTGEGEVAAGQVASKLSDIAAGISRVTGIVGEIAAATDAQRSGVAQVVNAISEMDKVTQQNAASAEESSSAASELSGQAEELAAMVATFRLASGHEARPGGPPARALAAPRGRA
jgi:methyl-accepting chemotaxis protein